MIAQILHHHSWEGIQAQAFCTYWGHASRIHLYRYSPISAAIIIRDARWACRACISTKRQPGNWPNACRFLQTLRNKLRPFGSPHLWDDASLDRHTWREFVNSWLSKRNLHPSIYYEQLQHVDLHGRCLLQVGETFKLLPMRHLPVEDPYPSSFISVPVPHDDDDLQVLQVCSDGSSRNRKGAFGVVVLPPYGDMDTAVICQGRVQGDCTNIRAEVLAAVRALKMILELRRHLGPHLPIKYMTDSSFVLQILSDAIQPTLYASEINELHHLWTRLCDSVTAAHVKGHKGHAINTLADHSAKQALYFSDFRVVYRNHAHSKAYVAS